MPEEAPAKPTYRTRLEVLFAARARRAVIVRRGPKRHFRLIGWDLGTDTFNAGQWMKGIVAPCDLSPDGRLLIYFAAQYHVRNFGLRGQRIGGEDDGSGYDPLRSNVARARTAKRSHRRKVPRYMRAEASRHATVNKRKISGTWTAVSPVPYFSALALWPAIGTWTGGGVFTRGDTIAIYESDDGLAPVTLVAMPARIKVTKADVHRQPQPSAYRPFKKESALHSHLHDVLHANGAEWVDWVSVHDGNDMLFGADGRVWRLGAWEQVDESRYLESARVLFDFRDGISDDRAATQRTAVDLNLRHNESRTTQPHTQPQSILSTSVAFFTGKSCSSRFGWSHESPHRTFCKVAFPVRVPAFFRFRGPFHHAIDVASKTWLPHVCGRSGRFHRRVCT